MTLPTASRSSRHAGKVLLNGVELINPNVRMNSHAGGPLVDAEVPGNHSVRPQQHVRGLQSTDAAPVCDGGVDEVAEMNRDQGPVVDCELAMEENQLLEGRNPAADSLPASSRHRAAVG